jgi:hypothetical protein
MIKILHNLALFRVKTLIFFGKNIFKILASVAGANPTTSELQLKRRRCSRQERFFTTWKKIFSFSKRTGLLVAL